MSYRHHKYSAHFLFLTVFVIHSLLFYASSYAQITWQRVYSPATGGGDEEAHAMCIADSGNFYVGGFTAPFSRSIYILKLNPTGDTIWSTRNLGFGEIEAMVSLDDGGCLFVGAAGNTAIAGRIRADGTQVWLRNYNAFGFFDVMKSTDGNFVLCGDKQQNGSSCGYLCKVDSLGLVMWERVYNTFYYQQLLRVTYAIGGNLVIGGITISNAGGAENAYLAGINDTGGVIWEKGYVSGPVFGLTRKNMGYMMAILISPYLVLMKTDSQGDTISTKVMQYDSDIYAISLLKENENKYYLSYDKGNVSGIFTVDSNFNILKQITFQAPQNSLSLSTVMKAPATNLGEIVCAGWSDLKTQYDLDIYVARIDSSLNQPPPIGFLSNTYKTPEEFVVDCCYPNPFNPTTKIVFRVKKTALVVLKIYDITGRVVKTQFEKFCFPGSYNSFFDGTMMASGIYFCQLLINGSPMNSIKMCLIK